MHILKPVQNNIFSWKCCRQTPLDLTGARHPTPYSFHTTLNDHPPPVAPNLPIGAPAFDGRGSHVFNYDPWTPISAANPGAVQDQNRWRWMTLNGVMALILRYFTEFGSFRGALRKIDWRCRREKSSRSLSHLLMSFLSIRCVARKFRHSQRSHRNHDNLVAHNTRELFHRTSKDLACLTMTYHVTRVTLVVARVLQQGFSDA